LQTKNLKTSQCNCPAYTREESAVACIRGEVHLRLWPTGLCAALFTWAIGKFFELSPEAVLVFSVMAVVPILFSFKTFFVCTSCGGEMPAEDVERT
jgi:hypothetical protein